jgi:hypothetical protein
MRTELKEFIIGLSVILVVGYLWNKIIEPSSFGGWIIVVIITLVSFTIIKSLIGKK